MTNPIQKIQELIDHDIKQLQKNESLLQIQCSTKIKENLLDDASFLKTRIEALNDAKKVIS